MRGELEESYYNSSSDISVIFNNFFKSPIFKSLFLCTGTDILKSLPNFT